MVRNDHIFVAKAVQNGQRHIYSGMGAKKKYLTHCSVIKISVEELDFAGCMFTCGGSAVGMGRSNSSNHHLRDDVFSAYLCQTYVIPETWEHRTGTVHSFAPDTLSSHILS